MPSRTIITFRRVATGLRLTLGLLAITVAYAAVVAPLKAAAQAWPPALDQQYPDLNLLDQDGRRVKLSSFRGKVIVIEPIGMSCPACQAFSGANSNSGAYGKCQPQGGLKSFEEYLKEFTGADLSNQKIVFLQLVLYNQNMQAPQISEIHAWARHFGLEGKSNRLVLAGTPSMVNAASYNMIPGFQLIDENFVLRSDSTGHNPRNDMWKHFFPTLKRML